MSKLSWFYEQSHIDWFQLSELYRVAPLGEKHANDLELVKANKIHHILH